MQLYASASYVVLYTNPRGSTSYGEEFANLIQHRYPGDDYADLMSAVDAALATGFIDADRLYVTGGSGGGILDRLDRGQDRSLQGRGDAEARHQLGEHASHDRRCDLHAEVLVPEAPVGGPGQLLEPVAAVARRLGDHANARRRRRAATFARPVGDSAQYYQALNSKVCRRRS